jgi:hypothetical protein
MAKTKTIEMTPVESSNLQAIGHDKKETLYVQFHSGDTWKYSPVTEDAFKMFLKVESKGAFFTRHIRNNPGIKSEKIQPK